MRPLSKKEKVKYVAELVSRNEKILADHLKKDDIFSLRNFSFYLNGLAEGLNFSDNIDRNAYWVTRHLQMLSRLILRFKDTENESYKVLETAVYRESERNSAIGLVLKIRSEISDCWLLAGLGEPPLYLPDHPLEGVN